MVQVRLYRPFPAQALVDALPASVRRIARAGPHQGARLDRRAAVPRRGRRAHRGARGRRARVMPRVSGGRYGLSSKEFTPGMVAGVFAELARERPRRRFTVGINDDVSGTSLRLRRVAGHRAAGHGPRGLLRARVGRHGRREQEHDQDPGSRGGPARPGLLRVRLEEVGLADRVAPALRAAADPGAVPRAARELRRLPPVRAARAGRRARPGGARRDAAAQLPARAGRGLGRAVAARPGADPRQAASTSTRSTPAGSPARSASPGGSTSCCRPASSPSPACCRATRRSPGSRRRSRRPTARRGAEVVETQPGGGRPGAGGAAPDRGARPA